MLYKIIDIVYSLLYNVLYSTNTFWEDDDMIIKKIDSKGNVYNYGKGYTDPYEVIPKHYTFNGLFYTNSNTKTIYVVEEE